MRDAYHDQLDELVDGLTGMCDQVREALARATRGMLEVDLQLVEQVITDDDRIDELRDDAEDAAVRILSSQAPVATDLRIVVAATYCARELERMGDLAVHIARDARRRHPRPVLPTEVAPYFADMGRIGCALASKTSEVIRTRDPVKAVELDSDDDAMDELHQHVFSVLANPNWRHGVKAAVDITLLARFYERYADHAVSGARRIANTDSELARS